MCLSVVNRPMETRLIYTLQKITFINSLCSQSKPPITILYIYHGKTSLYHRLVQQLSTIPWYFFLCLYIWMIVYVFIHGLCVMYLWCVPLRNTYAHTEHPCRYIIWFIWWLRWPHHTLHIRQTPRIMLCVTTIDIPWMPHGVPHTYTTWYSVDIIPIKFILLRSTVRLHRATYVYIPHLF